MFTNNLIRLIFKKRLNNSIQRKSCSKTNQLITNNFRATKHQVKTQSASKQQQEQVHYNLKISSLRNRVWKCRLK